MPVYSLLCGGVPQSGEAHTGFFVVPQGEQWAMRASNGEITVVTGPYTLRCLQDVLTKRRAHVANESEYIEIRFLDGKSEVGKHPVERRNLRQVVLRITAYADRLIDDLDVLDWSDAIKTMQRNWIGKSHGADVDFRPRLPGSHHMQRHAVGDQGRGYAPRP